MKRLILSAIAVLFFLGVTTGAGKQVGTIGSIDPGKKEIVVKVKFGTDLMMGDLLEVLTDSGKITIEVKFPMQTVAKCKLKKGTLSSLSKGMDVFKYSKETDINKTEPAGNSEITEKFGNIEMVKLAGGTFSMGSPENEKEREVEEIPHNVTLPSFWIGKYEITQKDYMDITGKNPSKSKGDNLPVENVKWYDAVDFCNKLSEKHGLKPYYTVDRTNRKGAVGGAGQENTNTMNYTVTVIGGNGFHLPTEAEWEYACRGGTTSAFHYGDKLDSTMANFNGNSPYNAEKGINREKTMPTGSFKPNNFGLSDMHGNVAEWCFNPLTYDIKDIDPKISGNVTFIIRRGGSWYAPAKDLRSARRGYSIPSDGYGYIGFRVVRSAAK